MALEGLQKMFTGKIKDMENPSCRERDENVATVYLRKEEKVGK